MGEESRVEPHQPVAPVQILESQSVFEIEFSHCNAVSVERAVDITPIFLWKWNDSIPERRCFLRERTAYAKTLIVAFNSPAPCRPCADRSRR